MNDILVVKSTAFLPHEKMQAILDSLMAQKETGVILLPPYLEAQIVPEDIEIKLTGPDDSEIMFVNTDKNYLKRRKAINYNFLSKMDILRQLKVKRNDRQRKKDS